MLPKISGSCIPEVVAVEFDLSIGICEKCLVVGEETVICYEWWGHVDKIAPKLQLCSAMGDGWSWVPFHRES